MSILITSLSSPNEELQGEHLLPIQPSMWCQPDSLFDVDVDVKMYPAKGMDHGSKTRAGRPSWWPCEEWGSSIIMTAIMVGDVVWGYWRPTPSC